MNQFIFLFCTVLVGGTAQFVASCGGAADETQVGPQVDPGAGKKDVRMVLFHCEHACYPLDGPNRTVKEDFHVCALSSGDASQRAPECSAGYYGDTGRTCTATTTECTNQVEKTCVHFE